MMPDIDVALTPVTIGDGPMLEGWLDDAETAHGLGFYCDVNAWLRLISADRHGWIAHIDGHPVGFLDLETIGDTCFFTYYVAPAVRRRRYGTRLLSALIRDCRGSDIYHVVGFVDPDNIASLSALRAAGFKISDHPDDEGMVKASRSLPATKLRTIT